MSLSALITQWDDHVLLWLNSFYGRWPLFDIIVGRLVNTNELKFGVLVAVFYWLWFRHLPPKQEQRAILVMTAVAGFVGLIGTRLLIAALPFRERPLARPELHFRLPPDFDYGIRHWSAFPSDHAVLAFAMATGFWLVSRRVGIWAYLHATFIICFPRVYFGMHHPSDVIAGALIGILIGYVATRFSLVRPLAVRALYFEQRYRGLFYLGFFLLLQQFVVMFSSLRTLANLLMSLLRGGSVQLD